MIISIYNTSNDDCNKHRGGIGYVNRKKAGILFLNIQNYQKLHKKIPYFFQLNLLLCVFKIYSKVKKVLKFKNGVCLIYAIFVSPNYSHINVQTSIYV